MAIQLNQSRFVGPMLAGIIVNGSANDVNVRDCIFSGCQTGLRFSGNQPDLLDVCIGGNTFHKTGNGIVFDDTPSAGSSGLVIARNLFDGIRDSEVAARHQTDQTAFDQYSAASFRFNWTSGSVSLNEIDVFANQGRVGISDYEFESIDPAHRNFLQPTTKTLPLTSGHPEPSYNPWVGAVKPLGL